MMWIRSFSAAPAGTDSATMTSSTPTATPSGSSCFDELTMLIGADRSGQLLEVGTATAEGVEFVVHAMPARPKYLR
jgi:hypothetical protein